VTKEAFINSVGIELVHIEKGTFLMGSPKHEHTRRPNEGDLHKVSVDSFYISKTPITQRQFLSIRNINPGYFALTGNGKNSVQGMDTRDFPVESVSWEEAAMFCAVLSDKPEEKAFNRTYRLPYETEWEYACRGGTNTPFNTGDVFTPYDGNILGLYPYGCDIIGASLNRPASVGKYKSNSFGLYDMHGNVWEWCSNPYYDYNSLKQFSKSKVLRGGSWNCYSRFCRSSYRCICESNVRYYDCGFRIVCEINRSDLQNSKKIFRLRKISV
jgi:formylglycine-generating enzyme required for sulfatase activity